MKEEETKQVREFIVSRLNTLPPKIEVDHRIADNFVRANRIFIKEVGKALINPVIKKPISKALYETWKLMDANEKERVTDDGSTISDFRNHSGHNPGLCIRQDK